MSSDANDTVAIVGPGAIGLSLAASLLSAGRRVTIYGRTAHPRFSHTFGTDTRTFETPIEASLDAAAPTRWVVLATKAYDVDGAAGWLQRLAREDATLAVVQNGVDHVDRVRPRWPRGDILPVVISMPCARTAPHAVTQRREGALAVPASPAGDAFARLFDPRVKVTCTDDWTTHAWTKLLVNATLGLCTLALAPNGALLDEPLRASAVGVLREIIAVGRAAGARLDDEAALIDATLDKIGKNPEHRSSITQDRIAGRAMEWDARNQVVVRTAERHGVAVPLNRALAAMLRAADEHRRPA